MYRGGILWTCIGLGPCTMAVFCGHVLGWDRVPWRYYVDMHWVGTVYHGGILWTCIGLRPGDRVPWRYSVDMHWVEAGGPCTVAVFCGHVLS